MCGIVGLYGYNEPADEVQARLAVMCAAIRHRGPDDEGFFVTPGIGLGMRRLSIIDVAGGHQPVANEDGSVQVVYNGEIYNFRELREDLIARGHQFRTRTDTEVLVHGYEQEGDDFVTRLNGMFGFALWDGRARRLLVARDRMGIKPLYYVETPKGLAFASEIKALLTLAGVDPVVDMESAGQYFRLGFVPAPRTLFASIRKLPPGWMLIAENGRIRLKQYWDLEFTRADRVPSFEESREQLKALLADVVRDQMVSDVPLGAFLSGGVDSSGMVAFMKKAAGEVRTFTIGFGSEHGYHNEAPYAEAAAKALGTAHETMFLEPDVAGLIPELVEKLDEPLTDTSFLNSYLVSRMARGSVTVALSGLGGDELFGGYRRYLGPMFQRAVAWIPQAVRRGAGQALDRGLRADRGSVAGNLGRYGKALGRTLHMPPGEQYLGLLSVLPAGYIDDLMPRRSRNGDPGQLLVDYYNRAPAVDAEDRLAYVDAKTVLPDSLLMLSDKMGMAASLEIRVPFLDNRLVDFVSCLPASYRLRGFTLKRLLKSSLEGVVPDFVLTRSKRGFGMPIGSWLRNELRPLVDRLLDPAKLRQDQFFDAPTVGRILSAHESRREDFTEPIVALLMFEIWRERLGVKLP